MIARSVHRLEGLEPDNPLAFLALLGVLRALAGASLRARVSWSLDTLPQRPQLHVDRDVVADELIEHIDAGVRAIAAVHAFDGRVGLNYPLAECRALLVQAASEATPSSRTRADLVAALMHDAAMKDGKEPDVDPTPLCLLFGQGHQHFLERLAEVPREDAPPARGPGKRAVRISAADCIAEALFHPWHRSDPTRSFRWDPAEDVRYATMAGDPTDPAFKGGTQHGANRLAAIGLATLTVVAEARGGRARPMIIGGARDAVGFSLAWPIWRDPATLAAITALLSHPGLRSVGALRHLGVDHVMVARRISVGKFMNLSRAHPLV